MNCFIVVDLVKDPILQRSLTRSTTRVSQRPTYLLLLACIIQFVLISSESRADSSIKAFVTKHCVDCHGAEQPEAGVELNGPYDDRALLENRDVWLRALQQLEVGAMPPDEPLPKSTELAAFKQTLLSVSLRSNSTSDWRLQTVPVDPTPRSLVRWRVFFSENPPARASWRIN